MKLVVGNKRYSSWSMRPWLVLRAFDIPFDEVVIPLRLAESKAMIAQHSPSGRVPTLITDAFSVWESLAIIEFLAETYPDRRIWPEDRAARAHARAIANEMHGGFISLRTRCPMDMASIYETPEMSDALTRDIARIDSIWQEACATFGAQSRAPGPFLFGAFSAADAMFAPVVSRFISFQIEVSDAARRYMEAVTAQPDYVDWYQSALREAWTIPDYASDHTLTKSLLINSETANG